MVRRIVLYACIVIPAFSAGAFDEENLMTLGDPERAYEIGSAREGEFYDCAAGTTIFLNAMVEAMRNADIVLLGEEHTHRDQHLHQAGILEEFVRGGGSAVLGMEFFRRSDQEVLEKWGNHTLAGDEFLKESGWYDRGGIRFEYYHPLMKTARRYQVPVVGLNVPRSIIHAVARGIKDGLSEEENEILGEIHAGSSPQHRYFIGRMFGESVAEMPPAWFNRMYEAQCVWDTVMARSILDNLPKEGTMIVIVGKAHVAYGLGIPRRILEEAKTRGMEEPSVLTFLPVIAPAVDPDVKLRGHPMGTGKEQESRPRALFTRSLGDYVGVYHDYGGVEVFPSFGFSLEEGDDGEIMVRMVLPDSLSEKAGVEAGDRVLDLNGREPGDIRRLRMELSRFRWGDRFDLKVEREGKERNVVILLKPDVRDQKERAAQDWIREKIKPFDWASARAVTEGMKTEEEKIYFLAHKKGRPPWIERRENGLCREFHELDEDGRVIRSVYADPLGDGTVEIRYERDPEGNVTRQELLDREGKRKR